MHADDNELDDVTVQLQIKKTKALPLKGGKIPMVVWRLYRSHLPLDFNQFLQQELWIVEAEISEQHLVIYQDELKTKNEGDVVSELSDRIRHLIGPLKYSSNERYYLVLSSSTYWKFICDWVCRPYDCVMPSSKCLHVQFQTFARTVPDA